ncbi:MAG: threonine--tRNA ligase [Oscillospiraceae bacterium]|jgi:threonyl-tRNA synthetase|nr:threonine--tRNA ligase [Oscillospiraceae bacterium]MCI1990947.1 threonine--tRNA ligase [Oscillospiraceae bacterium]MCI2035035.1 threonine--tRNA ligase [Oscillospiraceae bacterium]
MKIQVSLKGDQREFESGTTVAEIARSLGAGLYKAACAGKLDGKVVDLRTPVTKDCELRILTFDDTEGKKIYWHTTSHIMAQAVKRLFPDAGFAIGPAIENGFYYDFDLPRTLTPEDLQAIEAEMKKIIKEDIPLERFELGPDEAVALMEKEHQKYKVELIREHAGKGEKISFYRQGGYVDLCAGPHLLSTGRVKAVKLTNCTGAYWRADAKNKMLQRVYGISFPKASELESYLKMIEEAKKRDHRKLGRELDLFDIYDEGPGFPFFLPKGMILRNQLENFWREEHAKHGYEEIRTPIILSEELWHRSGHWDHYKDNMYTTKIDGADYAIKPMNCPGGMLVYKRKLHSYRDLPERLAELGLVHRHELSGALHGLMRVRCFTQDDAHIFMTPEQVEGEILGVMDLIDSFYKVFGFDYSLELSTRPENSMGTDEQWETATNALIRALKKNGRPYEINEGDGAFYGPKIDFHLRDSLGRTWQCGTIQLDFQMPERFELTYTGEDGAKHRPVMLHRVIFGSIERFIAILTEHYAGAFPLWLAPVQARILPISDAARGYAEKVADTLRNGGLRVETDTHNEKIGYKIREAQLQKIPYMLVVGEKEMQNGNVSVRGRKAGGLGAMTPDAFLAKAAKEVRDKAAD